ncbi:MAG: multiheme c-type cytochrome [Thiogranum sp.]|nr:multiheme c-type cytochrome [Thiogranum sp.]
MSHKPVWYIWIPLIIVAIAIPAGFFYVDWSKSGSGAGLYSRKWVPEAIFAYWSPDDFYQSVESVTGEFEGEQCLECHEAVTPGIVNDWRESRHSSPGAGTAAVYCSACHGNDHQQLRMPTPEVCGECHSVQHGQFEDEKRFGFPSHSLALERALEARHFVDKPKAEVTACLNCHSVASKCDSCHTRHRFSAAEARRPEACITCHSGPPHPDDETFFASAHGRIYLAEGEQWDWSKPLRKGNYRAPTCAYCHMDEGKHQVADKSIWGFGLQQINPLGSVNEIKRNKWVTLCSDCHEPDWSRQQLSGLDAERKRAWSKLGDAEAVLKTLRADDLLYPAAGERAPYPNDWLDSIHPRARIGFFEGQASAFYNVSPIERDYFEMWYFDNLGAYKGAAHGDAGFVQRGHAAMDQSLAAIKDQAASLRRLNEMEQQRGVQRPAPTELWKSGEYTEFNREQN